MFVILYLGLSGNQKYFSIKRHRQTWPWALSAKAFHGHVLYISYIVFIYIACLDNFLQSLAEIKDQKTGHTHTDRDWDRQMWENQNYLFDLSAQWCQLWDGVRHQQNLLSDTDKRRQRRGRVSDGSTLPDALSSPRLSRLVGADDPFNLANVRSFKARGNHRLCGRGARAPGWGRDSHGVGSRQSTAGDVWMMTLCMFAKSEATAQAPH